VLCETEFGIAEIEDDELDIEGREITVDSFIRLVESSIVI
jgi:hypothetical protein